MKAIWFERLGDVPGLDYSPPIPIDRSKLTDYDKRPEVGRYEYEDETREYLSWGWTELMVGPDDAPGTEPYSTGLNAPVQEHLREALDSRVEVSTAEMLTRLWEGLELPGEPENYHYAIDRVRQQLWDRRRAEPDAIATVESLAWLDIRVLLAWSDVQAAATGETKVGYSAANPFRALMDLYRAEGFMREAWEVAELGKRFDLSDQFVSKLRAQLDAIGSESAR